MVRQQGSQIGLFRMKIAQDINIAGVPAWKVKREFGRVFNQADTALQNSIGRSFAYYHIKFFVDPLAQIQNGKLSLGSRVAIYLIFPADGLQASHRVALDYIIKSGYIPIVVSNLPLTEADTRELLSLCAHLILRPNYGYDFGGYRDAVRLLGRSLDQVDYLAIFNDSSWFPVRPNLDWLGAAESMQLDFVASVFHDGISSSEVLDFSRTSWVIDQNAANFHYGSYSLLLGRKILAAKSFRTFWQNYIPSKSKFITIRRGEIGLTRWVIDNGYSHGATCDTRHLDRLLQDVPAARLHQIAGNLVTYDIPELIEQNVVALAQNPPDPEGLRNIILSVVARHGPAYALIDYDTRERLGNFIKKAPMHWNRDAAEATLRVLSQFDNPEAAAFLKEALVTYEAVYGCPWAPTPNHSANLVNTSA